MNRLRFLLTLLVGMVTWPFLSREQKMERWFSENGFVVERYFRYGLYGLCITRPGGPCFGYLVRTREWLSLEPILLRILEIGISWQPKRIEFRKNTVVKITTGERQ